MSTLALSGAAARSPEDFRELRIPPEPPPGGFRGVSPLLSGDLTSKSWRRRAKELRDAWLAVLGPEPTPTPLHPAIIGTETVQDHRRTLIEYDVLAGVRTRAFLLTPLEPPRNRQPGVVVLHQTTDETIDQAVGISGREAVHLALHLVRRGVTCLAPRNFLWSRPGMNYGTVTTELLAGRLDGFQWRTGMARMLWDARRATDLLLEQPGVDRARIGTIGHSLGAKEVVYHAAFDPRIRAAVSCEGGIGISFSNWEAPWYLGSAAKRPDFGRDHHELVALAAPRAFLLIGGGSADNAASWPYVDAVRPIYRLFDSESRVGLLLHPNGHDFPHPGADRELTYRWFLHHLNA